MLEVGGEQAGFEGRHGQLVHHPAPDPAPEEPLHFERGGGLDAPHASHLAEEEEAEAAGLHAPEPPLDQARIPALLHADPPRDLPDVLLHLFGDSVSFVESDVEVWVGVGVRCWVSGVG